MNVRLTDDAACHRSSFYEIHVKGWVQPDSGWFDGMQVTPLGKEETLIVGLVADQAALHGLLMRIRDLNLPLLSVCQVGKESGNAQCLNDVTLQ